MSSGSRGGGPVPAPGHWSEGSPVFCFRIVGLVFGECIWRKLAAQHQNHALIKRIGEPAARGRKRWSRDPAVRRRVVDVVHMRLVAGCPETPPDRMDFPFGGDQRHMIARLG